MSPLKFAKSGKDGGARNGIWNGVDRRTGDERRHKAARGGRVRRAKAAVREVASRTTRDLYKTDLDRHFWSWAVPSTRQKRRKAKERHQRRRRIAGILASAAGALGAAGLSYFLYRRLREEGEPFDPEHAEADLDEADFEGQ